MKSDFHISSPYIRITVGAPGAAPCNDGILTILKAQKKEDETPKGKSPKNKNKKKKAAAAQPSGGFLELKLHDDAGDLELWLYASTDGGKPAPLRVERFDWRAIE